MWERSKKDTTRSASCDSSPVLPFLSLKSERRVWLISANKFPAETQAMPLNSSACFLLALQFLISYTKGHDHCRRAGGFASSAIDASGVWPDEPLIRACWWLWETVFNDLAHLAQSAIPTCYECTCKRCNSAFAFLFEALSSYKIRQYEVYVGLCFTLYWVMWFGKVLKAVLRCLGTFQRILKPRFWWQRHLWIFSINLTFWFLEFIVFFYFCFLFS